MKTIKLALSLPFLFVQSVYYWLRARRKALPGKLFYPYGLGMGLRLLTKGVFSPKLFLNPVSIVRYFEFDFVRKCLDEQKKGGLLLDVASPFLIGFYLAERKQQHVHYINPDHKDLTEVSKKARALSIDPVFQTDGYDATQLPFENEQFDNIISVSVIEHVVQNGDSQVMKELWRVLKPGGNLILTFPVKTKFEEEYREADVYGLQGSSEQGRYFFQRFYDEQALNQRLLGQLDGAEIVQSRVFGESDNNFYEPYSKRWMKRHYFETVKDPYYIARHFRYFDTIGQLPGLGVMGLQIRKPI
ncbi:MAG: class I SAM-dependent methyltransferase [Cyclobacteriaceae bacterium]|nr:class I SAM-dependent methyltransferase [Cyclobacteriaceae bacterium]